MERNQEEEEVFRFDKKEDIHQGVDLSSLYNENPPFLERIRNYPPLLLAIAVAYSLFSYFCISSRQACLTRPSSLYSFDTSSSKVPSSLNTQYLIPITIRVLYQISQLAPTVGLRTLLTFKLKEVLKFYKIDDEFKRKHHRHESQPRLEGS
ncbi:unnamed protein product [Microthlaspi erraticum]|uniref:Uncharacterized protein n=1 Tax=Microthlaspi erraticum TaxID=1685480 RepID=A0A6D2JI72_9BRAS|nr:unnamed protein product [Microthlaspi erraticum]